MGKSNPVHLWRFDCTRALIFTQNWLNRPEWHLQKNKNGQKSYFLGAITKKNPVSWRAIVKGKMLHFVAFFVHFDKLIRPHPGPLCPPPTVGQFGPLGWQIKSISIFATFVVRFFVTLMTGHQKDNFLVSTALHGGPWGGRRGAFLAQKSAFFTLHPYNPNF